MDRLIADGVKVDAIITDPPYGTTACKWDSVIPFPEMWERLNKLIKPNGAIVLFGSEPFSSALRMSNIKNYKYDWIWEKDRPSNPMLSKKQPMRYTELISVFYNKQCVYNPQMVEDDKDKRIRIGKKYDVKSGITEKTKAYVSDTHTPKLKYPKNIQKFKRNWSPQQQVHSTQKPVALMEYLIKTYTNENETVLDFTMGSGTTGVACKNLNRNFIGIELDSNYFEIADSRINAK
jgi:site-specific DNA-methyltransferase (adenine-specific)